MTDGTTLPNLTPNPQALQEALDLSAEILGDLELSRIPLSMAALKASRLARLLNDFDAHSIFQFEAGGYPQEPDGIPPEAWRLLELAGRVFVYKDPKSGEESERAFAESLGQLEEQIVAGKIGLDAARDGDVSIASANPYQYVGVGQPLGNTWERQSLHARIDAAAQHLANRRAFIYDYTTRRHYELKFARVASDIFSELRDTVDARISEAVPAAVQKFTAVHENLRSTNPEDWSNAVHSCRRILQDLANALFPPAAEDRVGKDGRPIKLGLENHINRLTCYAEDNSDSTRFNEIVGSHLHYLGDRLDAIFRAAQKGSHGIVTREEANRYVVFTYILVGDLLSLSKNPSGRAI
ncbi:MAG: hypothetical protein ACHQ9S_22595 [Candidatus Binatia bacterium]